MASETGRPRGRPPLWAPVLHPAFLGEDPDKRLLWLMIRLSRKDKPELWERPYALARAALAVSDTPDKNDEKTIRRLGNKLKLIKKKIREDRANGYIPDPEPPPRRVTGYIVGNWFVEDTGEGDPINFLAAEMYRTLVQM
jgi:hypothetical protein